MVTTSEMTGFTQTLSGIVQMLNALAQKLNLEKERNEGIREIGNVITSVATYESSDKVQRGRLVLLLCLGTRTPPRHTKIALDYL